MTSGPDKRARGTHRWQVAGALVIASIMAGSLAVIAWQMSVPKLRVGPTGSLQAVTLSNGQVYYGTLHRDNATSIVLSEVFYVRSIVDASTKEPINKLISRADEDWHAPSLMLIPMDRIMVVERVGPQSKVAQLIGEARKR
jgi:hypothetical protein